MPRNADENAGNAYGRGLQTHDAELTEVGPGTPCGEFMRRYWHPIALSSELLSNFSAEPTQRGTTSCFRPNHRLPGRSRLRAKMRQEV